MSKPLLSFPITLRGLMLRNRVIAASATAAKVKRTLGFQVPYVQRIRQDVGIQTMAVGLILDAQQAEAILQAGQASTPHPCPLPQGERRSPLRRSSHRAARTHQQEGIWPSSA